MQDVGCRSYDEYQDYLEVHPDEFAAFFDTLLINVTGFFRDPAAWDFVADEVAPRILSGKERGAPIRVWSAGCASGEEAYTIAMILAEALGPEQFRERVKIYGTDVDEGALARARQAVYGAKELEAVPDAFTERYFEPSNDNGVIFRTDLRRSLIFGRHDLLQDAPISRLDLLVCRNTLMYFNAETQADVLQRFNFALLDQGFLFLGKAETLLTQSALFRPVELPLRVFQRMDDGNGRPRNVQVPVRYDAELVSERVAARATLRDAALDAAVVPVIVVDVNGALALANERARALFDLSAGDLGAPLQDLEVSYRPVDLRTIIEETYANREAATRRDVVWNGTDGERVYDVNVTPLVDIAGSTVGVTISFTDVTLYRQLQAALENSKSELETTNEELQSTNEELETTNEELQSTVEELETTNEELQSTNEELETLNEELQSTNDELQFVNDETERRGHELRALNQFFEAIMSSLEEGVAVVDRQLLVQIWNGRCEDLWGLRADEVRGQALLGLDIGLPVDQLWSPVRQCLDGNVEETSVTLPARNRRGREFRCRVGCHAFRIQDSSVEGVVLLMEDVDDPSDRGS
jgi:two-component system CheB/CheR fusion protein